MHVRCKGIFQHCMKLIYSYYYTKNNALNFLDFLKKTFKGKNFRGLLDKQSSFYCTCSDKSKECSISDHALTFTMHIK